MKASRVSRFNPAFTTHRTGGLPDAHRAAYDYDYMGRRFQKVTGGSGATPTVYFYAYDALGIRSPAKCRITPYTISAIIAQT